jgi:D-beta-D-heptose 7-phosphate kinase/D-beta-D-heptose 1-phosphate adenosyltransferase
VPSLPALIARFAGLPIAVVGDVMLDHFLVGRVDRISPEAPVPVVRFEHDERRLGGAANVAHNLVSLGAEARLTGVSGDDDAAGHLDAALRAAGIGGPALVRDASRPTTQKVRVVTTRNQQVARVDYESEQAVDGTVLETLIARIREAAAGARAVVLSDYRKGVVVPAVIDAAVQAARAAGAPLLVDPKVPVADRYRGATLITPNHHEAELMTQMSIRAPGDVRTAARLLHERTGASVLITWGEHGMWVLDAGAGTTEETAIPAAAREVADVTGAGDTVIAVLALGLAAGAPLVEAARAANLAAGLVVGRFGPATLSTGELIAAASAGA